MQFKLLYFCHMFLALIVAAASGICFAGPSVSGVTLALQAKLFHSKSGTMSADVLAPDAPELANVVVGEDASTSTFVVVAVSLASGKVLPSDSSVRLIARESAVRGTRSRLLLDKTVPLGAVNKGETMHIGFWLPDTGCRPVQLSATLTVARQPVSLSKNAVIPFGCYE